MIFADIETQYAANGGLDDIVRMQERCLSECGGDGILSPGDLCVLVAFSIFIEADRPAVSSSPVRLGLATVLVLPGSSFYLVVLMQLRLLRISWFQRHSIPLTSSLDALATLALTLTKLSHFWLRWCIPYSTMAGWLTFDTTPELFDTQFFLEQLLRPRGFHGAELQRGQADSPIEGEIRLMSEASHHGNQIRAPPAPGNRSSITRLTWQLPSVKPWPSLLCSVRTLAV